MTTTGSNDLVEDVVPGLTNIARDTHRDMYFRSTKMPRRPKFLRREDKDSVLSDHIKDWYIKDWYKSRRKHRGGKGNGNRCSGRHADEEPQLQSDDDIW